jgi:hypothetical protein
MLLVESVERKINKETCPRQVNRVESTSPQQPAAQRLT